MQVGLFVEPSSQLSEKDQSLISAAMLKALVLQMSQGCHTIAVFFFLVEFRVRHASLVLWVAGPPNSSFSARRRSPQARVSNKRVKCGRQSVPHIAMSCVLSLGWFEALEVTFSKWSAWPDQW